MKYLSVCSGMEAASVAWHPLGWTPVGFSEIEPFPCAILKHRFPNTPNYGSLTEYQSWPLEPGAIDLLVVGTPCQSFSVAGLRKGLEDPRGNLALVFLGLADKLKPRWIVWENVPGVLSSSGGRDFGAFLGALVELGYGFAYRVLDAQHFGVPQRRRRVFVVACLGDWRAPAEVLLEPDCVRRDPSTRRKKEQAAATGSEVGADGSHPEGCWWDGGQVSQTLDAVLQKGQTMPEKNRFPAVLQPVPIAFKVRGGGNYSGTKGGEVKPDEKGGTGYLGYEDKTFTVATAQDQWVAAPAYPINTLTLGGRPDPVNDLRMTMGVGADGDPQFTLQAAHSHAVATPMAVRRLTPVECERLQGFPDNWSRISWKGKPEEECPDGPRYKACGNSMAVPVMRWIGERIAEVDAKYSCNKTEG
jgi:DNA (cytosine-5)-methyltransferase 1